MKLGQLIEYKKRNMFIQQLCKKCGRETSSRALFIFLKCLILGKSKGSAAQFQYISTALNLGYSNNNKLYKTLDYRFRDILYFSFPEKGLGIVSPVNFMYDFSRKMFLMLYTIN